MQTDIYVYTLFPYFSSETHYGVKLHTQVMSFVISIIQ